MVNLMISPLAFISLSLELFYRISSCLREPLPPSSDLGESLRTGVYLAKLAALFAPSTVRNHHVFDEDLSVYHARGPHFRHTDNINYFISACKAIGLPEVRRLGTFL